MLVSVVYSYMCFDDDCPVIVVYVILFPVICVSNIISSKLCFGHLFPVIFVSVMLLRLSLCR